MSYRIRGVTDGVVVLDVEVAVVVAVAAIVSVKVAGLAGYIKTMM